MNLSIARKSLPMLLSARRAAKASRTALGLHAQPVQHLLRRCMTTDPKEWQTKRSSEPDVVAKVLPVFTVLQDRLVHSTQVKVECGYKERSQPTSPSGLTTSDTWLSLTLPLGSNPVLRDSWQLFHTESVRLGRVLELMDAFAADAAYRYITKMKQMDDSVDLTDIALVTASIDSVQFADQMTVCSDLTMTTFITWVGNTSMSIALEVQQNNATIGEATFLFAARSRSTGSGFKLLPLLPETPQEQELANEGERKRAERSAEASTGALGGISNLTEVESLLQTVAKQRKMRSYGASRDDTVARMCEHKLQNTLIMHSQDRNTNNQMFGGHLMRVAAELAWSTTLMYTGSWPQIHTIDTIRFLRPVDIGSVLRLDATVTHSMAVAGGQLVSCEVAVSMLDANTRKLSATNHCGFVFFAENDSGSTGTSPLVPDTLDEALQWLRGRRTLHQLAERPLPRIPRKVSNCN